MKLNLQDKYYSLYNKIQDLIPYSVSRKYFKIKYFFIWRNGWLRKVIPKFQYHDKDSLVEIVLFETLKNYVTEEVGEKELFNPNRWSKNDQVPAHQLKFERDLKKHYLLLVEELPHLQKILDKEWDKIPRFTLKNINSRAKGDYEKIYGKLNKAEKALEDCKDKICNWTVLSRRSLWS